MKIWLEFCDLYTLAQPVFLLCSKFLIIILKTVEVAETRTLLCHVYNTIFLSKSRLCNSSNKILSEFCDLYAHAQPIFLLCCKFQIIILKTVEVAEAETLLCHVYKTNFLSKSSWPRWLSWMRRPTGDQEVAGPTPTEVGNILSWRLIMKYFLRSFSPFRWFKKGSCQFLAKECAQYWLTA